MAHMALNYIRAWRFRALGLASFTGFGAGIAWISCFGSDLNNKSLGLGAQLCTHKSFSCQTRCRKRDKFAPVSHVRFHNLQKLKSSPFGTAF